MSIKSANQAFRQKRFVEAAVEYVGLASMQSEALPGLDGNFAALRRSWLSERADASRRKVGVCVWSLGHNPVGRALALAEAYAPHCDVELIGTFVPSFGVELWEPARSTPFPCWHFTVDEHQRFINQALELVFRHPYDVVHLCKPRAHNVIIGWLYQLVWGARVIVDIDDDELAFVGAEAALDPYRYIAHYGKFPELVELHRKEWTQLAVGLVTQFDGVTVSNAAIQTRFGGEIVPHVRSMKRFSPTREKRTKSRAEFGVPMNETVFLFYGTPRAHKGVVETARALQALGRSDICYVIAGGEPRADMRRQLSDIRGLDIRFLGAQPYDRLADVVALADACVLLQDEASPVSQSQLPAKLIDAFGMALTVFAQVTPPLEAYARKGALVPVTRSNLVEAIRSWLDSRDTSVALKGRQVFEKELTVEAVTPIFRSILSSNAPRRAMELGWRGQSEAVILHGGLPVGVPLSRPPFLSFPEYGLL